METQISPLIPEGNVSHPSVREYMMGFPVGYTDIAEKDGGQQLNLPQSSALPDTASLTDILESQPLEIPLFPSKPRSLGEELLTSIPCSKIKLDGGTQTRTQVSQVVVDEYVELMRDGSIFPPVIVFHDGENYWLADGFHRLAAAQALEREEITAEVRQGTRRDAVLFSVGANSAHGLRRSRADETRAVMTLLQDEEWGKWSNREIARRCGVSEFKVRSLRNSHCDNIALTERTYITKHGTVAKMNVADNKPSSVETELSQKGKALGLTAKGGQVLPDVNRDRFNPETDIDPRPFAMPPAWTPKSEAGSPTPLSRSRSGFPLGTSWNFTLEFPSDVDAVLKSMSEGDRLDWIQGVISSAARSELLNSKAQVS
ncbi:MAG: hypothetical protein NVSMB70_02160 [Chamaesiphon sp.]